MECYSYGLHEEERHLEEVDLVEGELVRVADYYPEGEEGEVGEGEDRVENGKLGLVDGEVIAGVFGVGVEVVEPGVDEHGEYSLRIVTGLVWLAEAEGGGRESSRKVKRRML